MLRFSGMCIDHTTGAKKTDVVCFPPPGQIYRHRKTKRHCLGIHPYPVMLDFPLEVMEESSCRLQLGMEYEGLARPMETVWGGGGEQVVVKDNVQFSFTRVEGEHVRSSLTSGQIPLLYYIH